MLFDIKKDYKRSLPHYEEALAIKNAIAGYDASDSASLLAPATADANASDDLVMRSLDEDIELPEINKATLSAAMTRTKMASVYAKVIIMLARMNAISPDNILIPKFFFACFDSERNTSSPSFTTPMH